MEIPKTLHKRIETCAAHVFQGLIPNWVAHGLTNQGYSLESLTLEWHNNPVGRIRLLTQCRQLYTLSHATQLGYISGYDSQIESLFHFILQHYWVDERWIFSLNEELTPLDRKSDAYALAFILLAFSHYYKLTGNKHALTYMQQTHEFLCQNMRHPAGGFYEEYPLDPQQTRRQNPHMHLLEGYVAAYQVSQAPVYLETIIELCELAHEHFVDADSDTLREFFQGDLSLDPETGHLVEPGHHFEWVWLLYQTYSLTGRAQDLALAKRLWHSANQYGHAANGGIINSFDGNTGATIDAEKRIWPITEYLKACCVITLTETERQQRLEDALNFIEQHYFIDNGRWIEYLDAQNHSKDYPLPGTTGYHIFLGVAEVLKWTHS
ncbi:AGE family epimerase/isomerase [Marinomonas ostreistagni]|uniref:AGE family epimerase/isomerase n=1 Tax=Marinomonas ostreistagni TaxID=359209 RepID=UPI0019527139|nr:AGE family epimerase/isomerase [Marinomonas ostreistagni]MBM6551217.1 AGE family epimerase/isomerase [Marinomonas ostreistagni]